MNQQHKRFESLTVQEQVAIVAQGTHSEPIIMEWDNSFETFDSKKLRTQMVQLIEKRSIFRIKLSSSLNLAMKTVPRHVFGDFTRFSSETKGSMQKFITLAYDYNQRMVANESSIESSPLAIAGQLSLIEIKKDSSILLVGLNSGYVQSLVAQLVGEKGSVLTISSNKEGIGICSERVNKFCPYKKIIAWKAINNIEDTNEILKLCQEEKRDFDTIIYCGAVDKFPVQLQQVLKPNGSILASVVVKDREGVEEEDEDIPIAHVLEYQQFHLMEKYPDFTIFKIITGFGITYEKVR